jgi:hypothetical protein
MLHEQSTLHFSTFFPQRVVSSFSYINYGLDQLQHPLVFLCAICSLYVRYHALSGCCKTHLLQMDRIVGFPIFYYYKIFNMYTLILLYIKVGG